MRRTRMSMSSLSAIWEIEPCRGSDPVASCALLRLLFVKAGGPLRSDIDPLPPHAHVNLVSDKQPVRFPGHILLLSCMSSPFLFCGYPCASSSFRIPTQSRNACYGARYLPSTLLPQSQRTPLAVNIRHKKTTITTEVHDDTSPLNLQSVRLIARLPRTRLPYRTCIYHNIHTVPCSSIFEVHAFPLFIAVPARVRVRVRARKPPRSFLSGSQRSMFGLQPPGSELSTIPFDRSCAPAPPPRSLSTCSSNLLTPADSLSCTYVFFPRPSKLSMFRFAA
ncbi:hypothetical protein C8Q74DRAFT_689010 [Fomes fomentarius]|nr:hypothetical protein C8Q74DRAFT_689010 [Fomes fomentarius]